MSSSVASSRSIERKKRQQIELERYEAKYIIHRSQVPEIREFIRPFVVDALNAQLIYIFRDLHFYISAFTGQAIAVTH